MHYFVWTGGARAAFAVVGGHSTEYIHPPYWRLGSVVLSSTCRVLAYLAAYTGGCRSDDDAPSPLYSLRLDDCIVNAGE